MAVLEVSMLKANEEGVVLVVTADGIRTIEGLTGEILHSVFITNVSFTTVVGPQHNVFAYISNDERLHRKTCHLYKCAPKKASEIAKSINEAFLVAHEEMRERKGNPFAAESLEREAVDGELFACQLRRKNLTAVKAIGAGQFGKVYLAELLSPKDGTSQLVAVKMLRGTASPDDKVCEFLIEGTR